MKLSLSLIVCLVFALIGCAGAPPDKRAEQPYERRYAGATPIQNPPAPDAGALPLPVRSGDGGTPRFVWDGADVIDTDTGVRWFGRALYAFDPASPPLDTNAECGQLGSYRGGTLAEFSLILMPGTRGTWTTPLQASDTVMHRTTDGCVDLVTGDPFASCGGSLVNVVCIKVGT